MAAALPAIGADTCDRELLADSLNTPFSGLRAAAAHAVFIAWNNQQPGPYGLVPSLRHAADEVEHSKRLLNQAGLQGQGGGPTALLAVNAPAEQYVKWRDCRMTAPGLRFALFQMTPTTLTFELQWTPPAGAPASLPLETWVEGNWMGHAGSKQLFPPYAVLGGFSWAGVLTRTTSTSEPVTVTARIGTQVAKLTIPALGDLSQLRFPRQREVVAMAAPYQGLVLPRAGGPSQLPGERLWSTTGGCHLGVGNARRAPSDRDGYRLQWTGACLDGWVHGQGTLLWFDHTERLYAHYAGEFQRGDLMSGDHWAIGSRVASAEPTLMHLALLHGVRINKKLPSSSAPPDLLAVYQQRHQAFLASRAPDPGPEEPSSEARDTFVAVLKGLTGGLQQYGYMKGQQKTQERIDSAMQRGDLAGEHIARQQLTELHRTETNRKGSEQAQQRGVAVDQALAKAKRVRGENAPRADECLAYITKKPGDESWSSKTAFYNYWCRTPAVRFFCSGMDGDLKRYLSTQQPQPCVPMDAVSYGARVDRNKEERVVNTWGWMETSIICFSGSKAFMRFGSEGKKPNIYESCVWE